MRCRPTAGPSPGCRSARNRSARGRAARMPDVPEAKLEPTEAGGLFPVSKGWFVVNLHDARWSEKPGQGFATSLTGKDEYEAETFFPMLGMSVRVMLSGDVGTT